MKPVTDVIVAMELAGLTDEADTVRKLRTIARCSRQTLDTTLNDRIKVRSLRLYLELELQEVGL